MKKTRLCYACAKSPATSPEDLDRYLRSTVMDKAAPCDRCGSRDYTKTFSPVAQKLRASPRGPTEANADTASNGEAEQPASNRTVAGSIPAGASL